MSESYPDKVPCTLVGVDGNAFSLMGHFKRAADRCGWPKERTKAVLDQCMSGDYDHLLKTLMDNCQDGGFGDDDE